MPKDFAETIGELQGAFDEFKRTHAEELAGVKSGLADVVTTEKLGRITDAIDTMQESITAQQAQMEAEQQEREALEVRLSRQPIEGGNDTADEVKAFNLAVKAVAAERGEAASVIAADDYAAYKAALLKFWRKGDAKLSGDEAKAMSIAVDSDGGYLVPEDMSGRMIMRVFETSPIRAIANVTTTSVDAIEGAEDLDEADFGWVGETATRTDTATPEVGRWRIPVMEMFAQPKATQRLLDDAALDLEGWLTDHLARRFSRAEATAFVSGDGVAQPRGFTSYDIVADASAAWGQIGYTPSGAAAAFASSNPADNLYDLVGTLKNEYLPNARWVTKRSVITAIRQFRDGDGQYLWQPSLAQTVPETIMGYPITRAEDLADMAANSYSLWFGDFREAYQIVDRIGTRILRDPYTDKPNVRFYATRRVGGGVVNFEAIKAMKTATS